MLPKRLLSLQYLSKGGATDEKDETVEQDEKANMLKTNKTKKLLVQKETEQLSLVMQHPSFQQNQVTNI